MNGAPHRGQSTLFASPLVVTNQNAIAAAMTAMPNPTRTPIQNTERA